MNLSLPRLRRRRARKPIDLRARRASIQLAGSAKQLVDTGRHRMAVTGLLFAACFAVLAGQTSASRRGFRKTIRRHRSSARLASARAPSSIRQG